MTNFRILNIGITFSLATMVFTGCMTQSKHDSDDAEPALMTEETANMGETLNPSALAKVSGDTTELIIERLHYVSACECFVRKANYEGHHGFERERNDTIWLYNVDGGRITDSLFHPFAAIVAKIVHHRHVTKIKNGQQIDLSFATVLEWKMEGLNLVGVLNGNVSGSFQGLEFKKGTITNLVRPVIFGRFGFPTAGSIHIERYLITIDIVFEGGGKATATITNTKNGNVHIIHIQR